MNLLVDSGNTLLKAALMENVRIRRTETFSIQDEKGIVNFARQLDGLDGGIVVSSGSLPEEIRKVFKETAPYFIELSHKTPLPIDVLYKTKETLGMDRVASAIGAGLRFPGCDLLVIDAGSAITLDYVNRKGQFDSGNIIPGIEMRFRALHHFTERLPLVNVSDDYPLLGKSTETAIRAGILNGIVFELNGYIDALRKKYTGLTVVITGGDANFFARRLKSEIFIDLNLIFAGLNRILEHNAELDQISPD